MTSDNAEHDSDRRRLIRLGAVAGILLVPLLVLWWPGCRQYPAVTSRESLSFMQLLNTACNTKDEKRLALVERQLADLVRQGKVSPEEKGGFDRIVAMAKAGKWEDAERAAFKFAQDQVGVGHPSADNGHDHGTQKREYNKSK